MFDSLHGRTCLHYAAYYGHLDCLQAILSAANSTPVADSWWVFKFQQNLSYIHWFLVIHSSVSLEILVIEFQGIR